MSSFNVVCIISVLLVKPPKFVSYIKSPPFSDAASCNAPESISCTQDPLLLRIIRWYILSTTGMLQNNSLVSHQQSADYMKLRMIYSICSPTFLNEHRKVTRTLFHIWKPQSHSVTNALKNICWDLPIEYHKENNSKAIHT